MCLELRLDLYNLESQEREFLPPGFRHLQTLEMTHFLPTKTPRLYPWQFSQFSHFQLTLHSFFFKSVTAKLFHHTTADHFVASRGALKLLITLNVWHTNVR